MKTAALLAALIVVCAGCGGTPPSAEQEASQQLPSLDDAVSKIKSGVKDAAEAAKAHVAENAEAEIDRISKELLEVADDFAAHSDQLQGAAKDEFEKLRIQYEEKKTVFDQKLKEFKAGSVGAKAELLKGLYDALSEMKTALDRAAEAFRQGADAAAPAEGGPA